MKTVIQDTAEILVTNLKTGKVIMVGEGTVAGIEQSISEEVLRGGIGNKAIFMLRSDKEITLNVTSATFDMEYLALTQGVTVDDAGTAEITKAAYPVVVDNLGTLEVTIPNAPVGLVEATIVDLDGTSQSVVVASGVAEIPVGYDAIAGDKVQVFYKATVTGRSIELNAAKFADKYKVEYRTIAYNVEDATIYSDIYFIFDEAIPSGNFSLSLESGSAFAPEMNFTVMTPLGTDKMGQMIEEIRA